MATVLERIGAGRFVSFELWPPRSAESASALEAALEELAGLGPAFVAITYGAGGSTRERTHDLVVRLVDSPMLPLAHLTCAAHGRAELVDLMRRYRRANTTARERWVRDFLEQNAGFRRYVLRELERRGPLLGRELEDRTGRGRLGHRWWGNRQVGLMLEMLHRRGQLAVVGRRNGQRLWDLAERWYPETEQVPWPEAKRILDDKRFRASGVRLERGRWLAHPDADDGPVGKRLTFLSPFDRLVHDRGRAHALWNFFYRLEMYVPQAKREYGYYVLPILRGDRVIGRIEPVHDRKAGELRVRGTWWEDGVKPVSLQKPLRELARWLDAVTV